MWLWAVIRSVIKEGFSLVQAYRSSLGRRATICSTKPPGRFAKSDCAGRAMVCVPKLQGSREYYMRLGIWFGLNGRTSRSGPQGALAASPNPGQARVLTVWSTHGWTLERGIVCFFPVAKPPYCTV